MAEQNVVVPMNATLAAAAEVQRRDIEVMHEQVSGIFATIVPHRVGVLPAELGAGHPSGETGKAFCVSVGSGAGTPSAKGAIGYATLAAHRGARGPRSVYL